MHAGGAPRLEVREGFLEEGTADSGASQVHRQGKECFKWKEEPSKGPETRKGMVQLRNQKRFGIARKLRRGKLKENLMAFHSRQKLF